VPQDIPINEYIYVNTRRLDAYFEQISSPVHFDKVPNLEINLSLTGLGVSGKQTSSARSFSTHEKITKLESYLKEHKQIETFDPADSSDQKPFVLYTFSAKKVFIPAKTDSKTPEWFKGLSLWISTGHYLTSGRYGRIYLFEDAVWKDDFMAFASAYSVFDILQHEFRRQSHFKVDGEEFRKKNYLTDETDVTFSTRPFEALAELGAIIIPEQRFIASLFRVRLHFLAPFQLEGEEQTMANVVGYPVFIAAGVRPPAQASISTK